MPHADDALVTLYATRWCGYCVRLKRGLDRAGVHYREVDVEQDAAAADLVEYLNGGDRLVPTLVFADEEVLVNPTVGEVQAHLATIAS